MEEKLVLCLGLDLKDSDLRPFLIWPLIDMEQVAEGAFSNRAALCSGRRELAVNITWMSQ